MATITFDEFLAQFARERVALAQRYAKLCPANMLASRAELAQLIRNLRQSGVRVQLIVRQ